MSEPIRQGNSNDRGPRPYWIPAGVNFDAFPEQLRLAITEVINPVYRDLVLGAEGGLEKSTGISIVSLLWMELLGQIEMGEDLADPRMMQDHGELINRLIRLSEAKVRASNFCQRLREYRQKWGHSMGCPPAGDVPADLHDAPGTERKEP